MESSKTISVLSKDVFRQCPHSVSSELAVKRGQPHIRRDCDRSAFQHCFVSKRSALSLRDVRSYWKVIDTCRCSSPMHLPLPHGNRSSTMSVSTSTLAIPFRVCAQMTSKLRSAHLRSMRPSGTPHFNTSFGACRSA